MSAQRKQATITGAATTIDDSDLTASRALVSSGSGKVAVSSVTSTELDYLDVTLGIVNQKAVTAIQTVIFLMMELNLVIVGYFIIDTHAFKMGLAENTIRFQDGQDENNNTKI